MGVGMVCGSPCDDWDGVSRFTLGGLTRCQARAAAVERNAKP